VLTYEVPLYHSLLSTTDRGGKHSLFKSRDTKAQTRKNEEIGPNSARTNGRLRHGLFTFGRGNEGLASLACYSTTIVHCRCRKLKITSSCIFLSQQEFCFSTAHFKFAEHLY
jgi:hypothetical protein